MADGNAKTITLLVAPEQGKLLNLATEVGKLHLAMRSKEDAKSRVLDKDKFRPEEADLAQAASQLEKNDRETSVTDHNRTQDALAAFLAAQQKTASQATKAAKTQEDKEPVAPKWKVEIFAGDNRQVTEVDLDDKDLPPEFLKKRDEWKSRQAKKQQPQSTNPLVNGIKSFFGPGEEAEPVEDHLGPNTAPQF